MNTTRAVSEARHLRHVWMNRLKRLATGRTDIWWYALQTKMRGLDLGQVSLERLGLSAERSVFHDNSGGPGLERILTSIDIAPGSVALDFGSGKGGAVLTLSRFPFSEIVGVELSEDLIQVAKANLARARVRHARFVKSDAAHFTDLDRITHVYMYHPFRCGVMREVMVNIRASLERNPRRLTVIYKNPMCHETLMDSGLFVLERAIRDEDSQRSENLFHVYEHRLARA